MGKKLTLDIYTEMDSVICQEWKDVTLLDGNKNGQPTED